MIEGLFFDLDGTLVNTYTADFLAYRDAIQEINGVTILQSDFAKTHGMEAADKFRRLVPELPREQYDAVRAAKKRYYRGYVDQTILNDSLITLIRQSHGHLRCVLVTTAKKDNVRSVLKHHQLLDLFEILICGDDVSRPKPDPQPYLMALEKTGLRADQVIAFEDSATGIRSAEAAGIAVIPIKAFVEDTV